MKLADIPAGEFLMGSPDTEEGLSSNEHQHRVRITKPFRLGVYQVTQAEYQRVMRMNPSWFASTGKGRDQVAGKDTSRFPVEAVSWDDAVEFCSKLSALPEERRAGRTYRLPTEAAWEYACRAGTTTPFHFGRQLNGGEANCHGNYPYATTSKGPYLTRTRTGGFYAPNGFGLHDMHGNLWEWCADFYGADYYKKSPVADPGGPPEGSSRVLRGGSWHYDAVFCRAASRDRFTPSNRNNYYGFRVLCVVE